MVDKGLDFKHKEVINIIDGKRLGYVQDVCAEPAAAQIPHPADSAGSAHRMLLHSHHGLHRHRHDPVPKENAGGNGRSHGHHRQSQAGGRKEAR